MAPNSTVDQIKNDRAMRTVFVMVGAALVAYYLKDPSPGVAVFLVASALRPDTVRKE